MAKPEEYVYIAVWGRALGTFDYYIWATQDKAAAQNAPLDSLYRTWKDTWFTASMLGKYGRVVLNQHCWAMGVPIPDYEGEVE